jgi:hypothetical protein
MGETEQNSKPGKLKKYWDTIFDIFKFVSTILGIIISAIALLGKMGDASADIKDTNKKVEEISSDMKDVKTQLQLIRENLIAKQIIKPSGQ